MNEAEVKARLEEVDSILKLLEGRKGDLLKALESLKLAGQFQNIFTFDPPVRKDSGAFRNFLLPRILEAHKEKYGIEYRISESNNVVSSIEFSRCSDEHRREIMNGCRWVQKVVSDKQGKG